MPSILDAYVLKFQVTFSIWEKILASESLEFVGTFCHFQNRYEKTNLPHANLCYNDFEKKANFGTLRQVNCSHQSQ